MQLDDINVAELSDANEALFNEFNKPEAGTVNFEDSYEYIRLYFDTGEWRGSRYYDGNNLIYLGTAGEPDKPGTVRFKIFKPLGQQPVEALKVLIEYLKTKTENHISITCLPTSIANKLKQWKQRQFRYYIYDTGELSELSGRKWKNVRQKVSKFERESDAVRIEALDESNSDKVVHFISSWRQEALHDRGFSYAQIDKGKFAARYYSDKIDNKNLWGYVYFISGKVSAFQLMYRLGVDSAANPIGFADVSIDGLAEYSQVHAWRRAAEDGIKYINDGPSWRASLEQFKKKFNPVSIQLVIECYV